MNITGLIFAAGLGTRLRPITLTIPKPLVPINNKPIIEYQIDWFVSLGISEIFINTHYLPEQFEYLPKKYEDKCTILLIHEEEINGHGGTLMKVRELATHNQILTTNGDTIVSFSKDDVESLVSMNNAVVLYKIGTDTLGFNNENELIRIKKKILKQDVEKLSGDFAGVAVFTKEYLNVATYPEGFLGLFGNQDVFEECSKLGRYTKGFVPTEMKRYEITTPEDIEIVSKLIIG